MSPRGAALAMAAGAAVAWAQAPDAGPSPDGGAVDAGVPFVEQVTRDALLGGRHWRLLTQDGAVHVWRPPGYGARSAGVVLYVHGYYTDVDGAWADHRLAQQFKESRANALFVVPEAPDGGGQDVQFKDLGQLLGTVTRLTAEKMPPGPVVAVGHSGAWRTLVQWLPDERLRQIVLLDAMYADEPAFEAWAADAAHPGRRLVNVGYETALHCEAFCGRFPSGFARRSDVPKRFSEFTRKERQAPLLYLQSQYDHMEIVTGGKVIPVLLPLCGLPRL